MPNIFLFLYKLLKAIPSIKGWWDQFMAFYIAHEIEKLHEADKAAIRKAIYEHDQRDLERQIGNSNPGEVSNTPGAIIIDELPGVLPSKKK